MNLILKLPVEAALLCDIWKLVAVEVIVRALPAQVSVPTCEPRTTTEPEDPALDLHKEAVIVGRVESTPLTHIINAPKLGRLGIFCATFVIAKEK